MISFVTGVLSNIGTSVRRNGIDAVHGRVHVSGSVTVYSYSSVSASIRVNRSTSVRLGMVFLHRLSVLKLAVSTTKVSPSQ